MEGKRPPSAPQLPESHNKLVLLIKVPPPHQVFKLEVGGQVIVRSKMSFDSPSATPTDGDFPASGKVLPQVP